MKSLCASVCVSVVPLLLNPKPHRFGSLRCYSPMHQPQPQPQPQHQPQPQPIQLDDGAYKPGFLDHLFLNVFRTKMVEEVGWDSDKTGYDGLIQVANRLMMTGTSNSDTRDAAVRILRSLFPPFLLELFRMLISPFGGGRVAAVMVARVTALTCQWLMGSCTVNSVVLPDGTPSTSGVFVQRCKYLEESKCVGICINTCKLPTQIFFKDHMGVLLHMEPNFEDYSCQLDPYELNRLQFT